MTADSLTTPIDDWKRRFKAAVDRRVHDEEHPIPLHALKFLIAGQLQKNKSFTPERLDKWLKGETAPPPDRDAHEVILGILGRYGNNEDQIADLRAAYERAQEPPEPRQPKISRRNRLYDILPRSDKEPELLQRLREEQSQRPFEDWHGRSPDAQMAYLQGVMERTESTAEYLACYRILNYRTFNDAAKAGMPKYSLRTWESGIALPEKGSLDLLKKRQYFQDEAAFSRFAQLVADNRRRLMKQALETNNSISFGLLLSDIHPHIAFKELAEALRSRSEDAHERQNPETGNSLIPTPGIALHFLRQALGISTEKVKEDTGISKGTTAYIEASLNEYKPQQQIKLKNYLKKKLTEYVNDFNPEQRDDPRNAAAIEVLRLLSDEKVNAWMETRARRARTFSYGEAAVAEGQRGRE